MLVDEYDKPIVDVLAANGGEMDKRAGANLTAIRNVLEVFKSDATMGKIHRQVVTGVTKFAHTALFSGANDMQDLTIHPIGHRVMGYSWAEVEKHLRLIWRSCRRDTA